MIMNGRAISPGRAKGKAVVYPEAFSFLGGVDGSTGDLNVAEGNISGKVFVFPNGKGSTVGSYVVYDLMVHGCAPAALINRSAETIVTTGAVISNVPMVDGVDISVICDGDEITVDGDAGTVEIAGVEEHDLAVVFPISGRNVLLHRQSKRARESPGFLMPISCLPKGKTAESAAIKMMSRVNRRIVPEYKSSHMMRSPYAVYHVHVFVAECDADNIRNKRGLEWVSFDHLSESDAAGRLLMLTGYL